MRLRLSSPGNSQKGGRYLDKEIAESYGRLASMKAEVREETIPLI